MRIPLSVIILAGTVAVAGCSNQGLRQLRAPGTGPDEFAIVPPKPLTQPADYAVLPAPTPGGGNLTDQNPEADAVAALGGRPSALDVGGIPASDAALVNASSRYGVQPGVRTTLAESDAQFRKRQARMTRLRLFPVDRYGQAYRKQALEPYGQAEAYRRAGRETPTSPPKNPKKR
jgi:hypothetical protein